MKKGSKNWKIIKNEDIEKQKSLRIMNKIVYWSNIKYSDLKDFLKTQFVIFRCQKYVKKRLHGNDKNNLPWALKKCPRLLYFTLLN